MSFKVIKGDSIEEQMLSIDRMLHSLKRTRTNQPRFKGIHAIPINMSSDDLTISGVVDKTIFEKGGEISGVYYELINAKRVDIIIRLTTEKRATEHNVILERGTNKVKLNIDIPDYCIVSCIVTNIEGNEEGQPISLHSCFSFYPKEERKKVKK